MTRRHADGPRPRQEHLANGSSFEPQSSRIARRDPRSASPPAFFVIIGSRKRSATRRNFGVVLPEPSDPSKVMNILGSDLHDEKPGNDREASGGGHGPRVLSSRK